MRPAALAVRPSLNQGFLATMMNLPLDDDMIETRFGPASAADAPRYYFKNGMPGIAGRSLFCLLDMPGSKWAQFKLLQSLEEPKLSFITLPLPLANGVILPEDLRKAAEDLGRGTEGMGLLLIVSVHREEGGTRVTVNARAPILLHFDQTADQYVMQNSRYAIQHPISKQG